MKFAIKINSCQKVNFYPYNSLLFCDILKAMSDKQWFEKENFWLNYGPIMFDTHHWAEAPGIAQAICDICQLPKDSKILDAGCGPGRITVELAILGMDVTGVDIIAPYLEAAQESAADEGVKITTVQADLRGFQAREEFDVAVNLYTSFGYCDTIEEDTRILQNIADAVKPGGRFVMECLSRENAVRDFTEGEWFCRSGKTVLTDFSVVGAWEGLRSRWILIDDQTGQRIEHEFVQRLYSAVELRKTLLECGFSSTEIYGDFERSPYDQKAATMVIICRK